MAQSRPDRSLARFERIALVLSGGEALGAYQAGAYAALERIGVRPNWIAGSGIGAVNAAIVAGNLPHQRVVHLRQFWRQLGEHAARGRSRFARWIQQAFGCSPPIPNHMSGLAPGSVAPVVSAADWRELINEAVDFGQVNSGALRVVLSAVNLATGAETLFDNDRHVLSLDHVMAGMPMPGLPPVTIDSQRFGGGAAPVSELDDARPANTLCFAIDGYDPVPANAGGASRSAREIAALRRIHDLRRMIALLSERVPRAMRSDPDIRHCLAEASYATMTILHLVHEGSAVGLAAKMADYSPGALARRWNAGESDIAASLAHPRWLEPPPRLSGVVVHEIRGGVVESQR